MNENHKAFALFCLLALIPGGLVFAMVRQAGVPLVFAGAAGAGAWYAVLVAQSWAWFRGSRQ